MPTVRNISDRALIVGNRRFEPGQDTDVDDEWAAALLTNPNFESPKPKPAPKPKADKASDNAQEG